MVEIVHEEAPFSPNMNERISNNKNGMLKVQT